MNDRHLLTGAILRRRQGDQESLGIGKDLSIRKEHERIFHQNDRENDRCRRDSQNARLEDSPQNDRPVPGCSDAWLLEVFTIIGANEREAIFPSQLVMPPLIVLIEQYPAIEVEKAAIAGANAEKS